MIKWRSPLRYSFLFFLPTFKTSLLPFKVPRDFVKIDNFSALHSSWPHLVCIVYPCFQLTRADCLAEQIRTTVTDLLKINHPIMLAGMNVAAGPKLAAAVTNAGGLGVIGGVVGGIGRS
jgi:hypothetical protein